MIKKVYLIIIFKGFGVYRWADGKEYRGEWKLGK